VLGPADDAGRPDVGLGQLRKDDADHLVDILLPFLERALQPAADVVVFIRVEILERVVFELSLEPVDTETAGQGRIEIHGLAGDIELGLLIGTFEHHHILQPVDQLDQQYADIGGDSQQHLADVLRLVDQLAVVLDLVDLGGSGDDGGHVRAELAL
jgi:hypothetical protein